MTEWVNNWTKYKAERDAMKEHRDCVVVSFCEIWERRTRMHTPT